MAEFIVTAQEVRAKAVELRKLNDDYRKLVDDLQTEVSKLSGMWEGEAHDTFDIRFKKDAVYYQQFYNTIVDYCVKLDEIAVNYSQAETKNIQIANGSEG